MFDYDSKFDPNILKESVSQELVASLICKWDATVKLESIRELSGGYSNSNFFFESSDRKQVLRIFHKPIHHLRTEVAILKHLELASLAPQVRYLSEMSGINFCIMDFIEGPLLSDIWRDLNVADLEKILVDLGKKLRQVHSFTFKEPGFFGPNLDIESKFERGVGSGYFDYIIASLASDLVCERLGKELTKNTLGYVRSKDASFLAING
ncbi:MAG: phosphotransferase, partial [Bdellovibrionota bacterium]